MRPFFARALRHITTQRLIIALCMFIPFSLETLWHTKAGANRARHPVEPLDTPFITTCREPDITAPREKAAAIMLARNEDLAGAKQTIESWEQQFNQWFHYPVVFLNDKSWSKEFIKELSAIASGKAIFETVPQSMWDYPDFIDKDAAKASIDEQGRKNLFKAGDESYHHMCRFFSGHFYDHPALQPYEYFWRIEPNVLFTCAVPYDPFRAMREHGKKYGYAMALWELGNTSPSLFRAVADYKASHRLRTTSLWSAMVDASWAPWPLRKLLAWMLPHRDRHGDAWNLCHFWSNFEIADFAFFRSKEYRDFFDYLDGLGGFYFERWGDAPVHSLAAALFLDPSEIHRFDDIGYSHPPFWTCPQNAWKGQMLQSKMLGIPFNLSIECEDGIGCRCSCFEDDKKTNYPNVCFNKFDRALGVKEQW